MLLEVLQYPHKSLRAPTKKVTKFNKSILTLASNMVETMIKEQGQGIAAPQVGVSLKLIICLDIPNKKTYVLCNPVIIKASVEKVISEEGCLSFKGQVRTLERFKTVTVKYQDVYGKFCLLNADRDLSICLQHEIDHLNMRLFID